LANECYGRKISEQRAAKKRAENEAMARQAEIERLNESLKDI
jgi:hypothetical protein